MYNINDIYQIRIDDSNVKYWLLKENNDYKDFLNSGLIVNKNNITIIQNFVKFLQEKGLETMLLIDYNDNNLISKKTFLEIIDMYERMKLLSKEEYDRINLISQTVADKCCFEIIKSYSDDCVNLKNHNIKGLVDKTNFWKLLQEVIKLELIKNLNSDRKSSICKAGLYLDYKICSILNFLNVKYSASNFRDFRIEYDCNSIYQYDKNGDCCFNVNFEKSKSKNA